MPCRNDVWTNRFKEMGALWVHDGNPKRPHALLTSGKHSNGFFNSGIITANPYILFSICFDLNQGLEQRGLVTRNIDRVVGPAMGAIVFAYALANLIAINSCSNACLSAYVEKDDSDAKLKMVFKRVVPRNTESILLCEDVLTTGHSLILTAEAVKLHQCNIVPFVAVIVNRSGMKEIEGREIVSLVDLSISNWNPEDCPLCKKGSEAVRPKTADNWERLRQQYS